MSDESLHWPGSGVTQRANGVTFDLLRQLPQRVNFIRVSVAFDESVHDLEQPRGSFAARSALTAGFVNVEFGETSDGFDDVGAFVHHDHGRSAKSRLDADEGVEVHQDFFADVFRKDRDRRSAGDDAQQIVPSTANAPAVALDQFLQRNGHFLRRWSVC